MMPKLRLKNDPQLLFWRLDIFFGAYRCCQSAAMKQFNKQIEILYELCSFYILDKVQDPQIIKETNFLYLLLLQRRRISCPLQVKIQQIRQLQIPNYLCIGFIAIVVWSDTMCMTIFQSTPEDNWTLQNNKQIAQPQTRYRLIERCQKEEKARRCVQNQQFAQNIIQSNRNLINNTGLTYTPILYLYQIMLAGKRILVVGGTGYAGKYITNFLSKCSADVYTISRKGSQHGSEINAKCFQGDIMNPQKHIDLINDMDIIVHSVGTLVDTSITKRSKPGEPGTYEQVNRDTFLSLLRTLRSPKKIFYISADASPPLIPARYITAKQEAQKALLQSENQGYILKPALIYSWQARGWTLPLKVIVDQWIKVYNSIQRYSPSFAHSLKGLKAGEPTSLKEMAKTIAYICNRSVQEKRLFNKQISKYSDKFDDFQIKRGNNHQ